MGSRQKLRALWQPTGITHHSPGTREVSENTAFFNRHNCIKSSLLCSSYR